MEISNPSCSSKDTNSQVSENIFDDDDDLVFDSDGKFYLNQKFLQKEQTKESIKLPQQTVETEFKQTDVQKEDENCDNFIESQQKEAHGYENTVEQSSNKWQEICNSFEAASITPIINGSATGIAANYSGINSMNDGKFNEF